MVGNGRERTLGRVLGIGLRYRESLERAGVVAGSPEARRLGATIRAICEAGELPGPQDQDVPIPPIAKAYVRRVPGMNLWLYYDLRGEEVVILWVRQAPPVPILR